MSRVELHRGYGHEVFRVWQTAGGPSPDRLIWPLFVVESPRAREPIPSMPGQFRWGVSRLREALDKPVAAGLRAVLLFGSLQGGKDPFGRKADADDAPVPRAIRALRTAYPDLVVIADVCLCSYTDHGHCGILTSEGHVDNDATVRRLAEVAVAYAAAGAHAVAPSDMMDNRVAAIRAALDAAGHRTTAILSYAAKFASCFYGPFRDAARSAPAFGDRRAYQLPPGGRELALRALERDVNEGADFVLVKPGLPYLDLVREAADRVPVPVLAYQVSGEYSMLLHAARAGAFELSTALHETLTAFHRAGARAVITYFAPQLVAEAAVRLAVRSEPGSHGGRRTPLNRLTTRRGRPLA